MRHKNQGKLSGKEQEIIKKYLSGIGTTTLGKQYGVAEQSIVSMLKRNDIPIRSKKVIVINKLIQNQIVDLYIDDHVAPINIAPKFDLNRNEIIAHLEDAGVKFRSYEDARTKYKKNEDFFDTIDCEEKAYFLGFMYADGCNQMLHHWNACLSLEQTDKDILYKLARLIFKENPDDQVIIRDRTSENKGISATVNINSKHICKQLAKLGCVPQKTFILTYPKWMPANLHRHFIRGYFDGDGSLWNVNKVSSGCNMTSTLEFLQDVQKIIPVASNIYKHDNTNDKNTYTMCISGNRNMQKFLNWIYSGSTYYLQRKYNLYLQFCKKMDEVDAKVLAGTQGFSKSGFNRTYPGFSEIININEIDLTKANIEQMSVEEKENMSYDVFDYFRSIGFNFQVNKDKLKDYEYLCKNDIKINNNEIKSQNNICSSLLKMYCQDYFKAHLKNEKSVFDSFNDDSLLLKCIQNRLGIGRDEVYNITPMNIIRGFNSSLISPNVSIFKPAVAKAIYQNYTSRGDIVYDYSAGWGSRMLGAVSCGRKYIGVDPATISHIQNLANDLNVSNEVKLIQDKSENYLHEENSIDFCFSSPPYFDLEIYSNDLSQSYNNGKDYFYNIYWAKTLENCKKMLKPNKLFSINVSEKYEKMINMARGVFGQEQEKIKMVMGARRLTNIRDDNKTKFEYIYIFNNIK